MSRLVWDDIGARQFETGIDKGVLYTSASTAIPWNGLISVEEDYSDSITEAVYVDGVKRFVHPKNGDFKATLKAFTYPDEFDIFDGLKNIDSLLVSGQPSGTFGLSYRTRVGNDVQNVDYGYKIHILYQLTASSDTKNYNTQTNILAPMEFSWNLRGIPQKVSGYAPSVHISFDGSTVHPLLMTELTDILWGTATVDARLPTLEELMILARDWELLKVFDNGDGTFTVVDHIGALTMLDSTTFQINVETAVMLDSVSYKLSDLTS